jgi:hypothetical protein
MSHWFDRLATWSAEGGEERADQLLTRRQAVRAGATGAGAIGIFGLPLVSRALATDHCDCADRATRKYDQAEKILFHDFILSPNNILFPVDAFAGFASWVAISNAYLLRLARCPACPDKPLEPPPPKFQPCTKRGGVRLRGDQCGGDVKPEPPETGCAQGTKDCGGGLCCFGDDLCCGGCCCIAPVGCGCCG